MADGGARNAIFVPPEWHTTSHTPPKSHVIFSGRGYYVDEVSVTLSQSDVEQIFFFFIRSIVVFIEGKLTAYIYYTYGI